MEHLAAHYNKARTDSSSACKQSKSGAAVSLPHPPVLQDVQKEVLDYMHDACKSFQDYEEMCEQYVETYGPIVFNLLLTYAQPQLVCNELGFCKASTGFSASS